jgi:hypothetical protein
VILATYTVEVEDNHRHLRQISNPRLVETPFHSLQLTLWILSPDGWLIYWRTPDPAPPRRKRRVDGLVQSFLFDFPLEERPLEPMKPALLHLHTAIFT